MAYLNFSAEFYHDSHGDLRIELVHGEQRVQIYSGQETASPNAYGPLYVNINSADSEAMAQFLNAAATGDWSVEIFDDGALEVGSLKTASLDLSFQ